MLTVAIPVGPFPHHRHWLEECLESAWEQNYHPNEILLVDDGGGGLEDVASRYGCTLRSFPFRLGLVSAFNAAVSWARNDLVFMLGSDDMLFPACVEECLTAWDRTPDPLSYFYVDVQYSDGRTQDLPCHAAMVTKALWQRTGGLPPESAVGAPDAALISILLAHSGPDKAGTLRHVAPGKLLYWHRIHENQDTASRYPWRRLIIEARNLLTEQWRPFDSLLVAREGEN